MSYHPSLHSPLSRRGFTLLEMAIVLVIIGLLTGGIFIGKSLLRQSQLMSVAVDVQNFTDAANRFQGKYKELPGDMADAQSYWGAAPDCAAFSVQGTAPLTCNGNGNGTIGDNNHNEQLFFWQHLSNAKMLQATYTGYMYDTTGHTKCTLVPGKSFPATSLSTHGGYQIVTIAADTTSAGKSVFNMSAECPGGYTSDSEYTFPLSRNSHYFMLGIVQGNPYFNMGNIVTPGEAQVLDQKMDDGKPGTGNVITPNTQSWGGCASSSTASTAVYQIGVNGLACIMFFNSGINY